MLNSIKKPSILIVCLFTILILGIIAKSSYDESKNNIVKYNEISEEIPRIISYDEENAREIFGAQGFSYIIE